MQKSIMFIVPTLGIGGAEKQLANIVKGLLKKGDYHIEVSALYKLTH